MTYTPIKRKEKKRKAWTPKYNIVRIDIYIVGTSSIHRRFGPRTIVSTKGTKLKIFFEGIPTIYVIPRSMPCHDLCHAMIYAMP